MGRKSRRYESDSSESSESDVSITKAYVRKRSHSRHRDTRDARYLIPAPAVHRSASTGGRRPRKEQAPTVVVDINNDMTSRQATVSKDRKVAPTYYGEMADTSDREVRSHRRHRAASTVSSRTPSPYQRDWDMVVDQRFLKNNDARQDFELMKHQQEIESMKRQQELERLERAYREPPREVTREVTREVQLVRQEEDYDDDVHEKLKKLERLERKKHLDEERRLLEFREKARTLEEKERIASEENRAKRLARDKQLQELERKEKEKSEVDRMIRDRQLHDLERKEQEKYDLERLLRDQQLHDLEREKKEKYDMERAIRDQHLRDLEKKDKREKERVELEKLAREQKLHDLEKKEKDKAERDRIRKELKDEETRRELEEQERKKEQDKIRAAAIEDYKRMEERKKMEALREKEKRDKEFNDRLKSLGYTDEQIDGIVNKRKKDEKEKEEKEKREREEREHKEREKERREREKWERRERERWEREREKEKEIDVREETKTTYIKVHRKYLLPETLNAYNLPWEWDDLDGNYIIIKTYISKELQEELFAHTRRLREPRPEPKLLTETSSTHTELRVNDRNRDKMYLVRKKSPAPNRRSWILT